MLGPAGWPFLGRSISVLTTNSNSEAEAHFFLSFFLQMSQISLFVENKQIQKKLMFTRNYSLNNPRVLHRAQQPGDYMLSEAPIPPPVANSIQEIQMGDRMLTALFRIEQSSLMFSGDQRSRVVDTPVIFSLQMFQRQ